MEAVALALASCLTYGFADFAGAACARRAPVLRVCRAVAATGLVVELLLVSLAGARFETAAVGWGAASGVAAAAAMALLYRCLATGPMTVLSPVTAVVSAVVPVGAGLLLGERLDVPHAAGIPLALGAAAMVSMGPGGGRACPRALLLTAGVLDALANVAFLLSVRSGLLAVTAVIVALYPAGTLLLARGLLAERLHRPQLAGLAVAGTAVALLTVPG
jgi:drug/metabolite transporter (DMT)-like permease